MTSDISYTLMDKDNRIICPEHALEPSIKDSKDGDHMLYLIVGSATVMLTYLYVASPMFNEIVSSALMF